MGRIIARAIMLVVVAGCLSGVTNALRRDGLRWDGVGVQSIDELREAQAVIPGVERTEDLGVILAAYGEGSANFVDARNARDYAKSHVVGAVSLPSSELSARLSERAFTHLIPDMPIVVYCDNPTCPSANRVTRFLLRHGFTGVKIYVPGWRGHPGLKEADIDKATGAWLE